LRDLGERPAIGELIELLEAIELPPSDERASERVLLAEPLEVRARRFRAVVLCGLCEGEFPIPAPSEPFFSDERRREIAFASGLALRPVEDGLARERHLLYAAVSRATEQLLISYRSSDEEGNLVLPSPFLADIKELFVEEWSARRRRRLLADVVWSPEDAPTARERERALATRGPARQSANGAGAGQLEPTYRLTESALRRVRHARIVSAGALEAFAACPVKWLIERELEPKPLAPEPEPIARGKYMHGVLEQLLRQLGRPVTQESLPEAKRMLEVIVDRRPP
jgi:ATP-dependent helicase/DNAse subunit B